MLVFKVGYEASAYYCHNFLTFISRTCHSPQWLCGNSCVWAHDGLFLVLKYSGERFHLLNRTSWVQVELPQSHSSDNWVETHIISILLLWDLSILCVINHITYDNLCFMYIYTDVDKVIDLDYIYIYIERERELEWSLRERTWIELDRENLNRAW